MYPGRTKTTFFLQNFNKSMVVTISTNYLKFEIRPKYKELHFKIIYNI